MRRPPARTVWSAADQGVSSLTNFVVNLLIVRSVPLDQYGIFVLALTAYTLAQGLLREATATPLFVRYTTASPAMRHEATGAASGVALSVGLALSVLAFVGALFVDGQASSVLLVLGLAFPGLMLQDALRMALLADGRGRSATLNDAVWGGLQLVLVAGLLLTSRGGLVALSAAWALSASAAAVVGLWQLRLFPRPRLAPAWIREHRQTIIPLLTHFGATNGGRHLATYAVGLVAGLQVVGLVGAAQMLLSPLNVLFMAATIVGMPEGARLLQRSHLALRRMTITLSSGLVVITVLWTAALLSTPTRVGVTVVGDTWADARGVVWLAGISMAIASVSLGSRVGLRVLEQARPLSTIALVTAPIGILLVTAGAARYGAIGAIGGTVLLNIATSTALTIAYKKAMMVRRTAGEA